MVIRCGCRRKRKREKVKRFERQTKARKWEADGRKKNGTWITMAHEIKYPDKL